MKPPVEQLPPPPAEVPATQPATEPEIPKEFAALKRAFDSANPARIEDYPRLKDLNPSISVLKCVAICTGCSISNQLTPVRLGRVDLVAPGIPGNGPLFPGTPNKVTTVLTPQITMTDPDRDMLEDEIAAYVAGWQIKTSITEAGELQTETQQEGAYPLTSTYRKADGNLYFRDFIQLPGGNELNSYGYCFSK